MNQNTRSSILLIFGILVFLVGVIFIYLQVAAEGNLALQLSIFQGNIQTGNAGLFICFFGFVILFLSTINFSSKNEQNDNEINSFKKETIDISYKIQFGRFKNVCLVSWIISACFFSLLFLIKSYSENYYQFCSLYMGFIIVVSTLSGTFFTAVVINLYISEFSNEKIDKIVNGDSNQSD